MSPGFMGVPVELTGPGGNIRQIWTPPTAAPAIGGPARAAAASSAGPEAFLQDLLYLVGSRFAGFPPLLTDTPLLTKELVRLQVPWAIYTGPVNGPRVPFLAVGKFARPNVISHVPLEISSVTKLVEWNWLHGSALKGIHEPGDLRRYRDTTVNNLGSLIDPAAAGAEVPSGRE